MKSVIATAITTLGIGLATNVFASASGTQVNPSTINLSASGVSDVGIHTQLPAGTTLLSCVHVVDNNSPVANTFDFYAGEDGRNSDQLTLGADSNGTYLSNNELIIK